MRLSELLTILHTCVDKEDLCYKSGGKSDISVAKEEIDKERDRLVIGFKELVKSSLHHFEDNIRKAASRIKLIVDKYNRPTPIQHLSYDAETVAITNLLQELEEKYQSDVDAIGAKNWLQQLNIKNDEFKELILSYNEQQSEKPTFTAAEARKETDAAYVEFVKAVEGLVILEKSEPDFVAFAKELNTYIKHYNDLVAQHKGRLHANEEPEE
jgi:hypothetical protein